MGRPRRFAAEVRERAVRLVLTHQGEHESQWAAIRSIAGKIGCSTEALRHWVRQAERDHGARPGLTTEERERLRTLERENRDALEHALYARPERDGLVHHSDRGTQYLSIARQIRNQRTAGSLPHSHTSTS